MKCGDSENRKIIFLAYLIYIFFFHKPNLVSFLTQRHWKNNTIFQEYKNGVPLKKKKIQSIKPLLCETMRGGKEYSIIALLKNIIYIYIYRLLD